MKNCINFYFLVLLYLVCVRLNAQEGHFTQFFNSSLYSNPAEAGRMKTIRLSSSVRKQWPTIANGFTTKNLGVDMLLGKFGYGIDFSANDAGVASLRKTGFMFNMAHEFLLNKNNSLSVGYSLGFVQYSVNMSLLKFDNQYNVENGFNANTSNGESFSGKGYVNFNGNAGAIWQNTSSALNPKFSFSVKNLFQPQQTSIEINRPISFRQYNFYGEINRILFKRIEFIPYLLVASQSTARYLHYGVRLGYKLNRSETIYIGTGILKNDAVVLYFGMPYKKAVLGVSYEINTSRLVPATAGKGALEFSLVIHFKAKDKRKLDSNESVLSRQNGVLVDSNNENERLDNNLVKLKPIAIKFMEVDSPEHNKLLEVKIPVNDAKSEIVFSNINKNQILKHYYVYFDSDKSVIKTNYVDMLNQLANEFKGLNDGQLLVNGHTDSDGDSKYNLHLGDARAKQVMNYLVEQGVFIEKIQTFTYGKSSPQSENSGELLKAKNRRVEIILLSKEPITD
jgi:type IX secretion system PorP/SprF family membrane protein